MPSLRHELYARVIPRLRRSGDLDTPEAERRRMEAWHTQQGEELWSLPTRLVPRFTHRYAVVTEELGEKGFPSYTITRRHTEPIRTLYYLHGGGYVAPLDAVHVRYATRLADALDARLVLPTYPLAPEHTWRDSHEAILGHAARFAGEPGGLVLAGDSAGGGYALAVALGLRDRGTPASRLLLHAPWVDLTTSTPETAAFDAIDPWLFLSKLHAYADWWAGVPEDLGRPEVSPGLADLAGLPPALMFSGTRDLLAPGCRLLARRAAEAGWQLTAVEEPDLIHVYAILPGLPEAKRAWRQTVAWFA